MWYVYTMEYHSATQRNETGSSVELWMDLESVIQSEVRQTNQVSYFNVHMWNLEKWYR